MQFGLAGKNDDNKNKKGVERDDAYCLHGP